MRPVPIVPSFHPPGKADEVIDAIAQSVAGMTSQQAVRSVSKLSSIQMRQIIALRWRVSGREEATSAVSSHAKH